jgi:hypothetical protein
MAYSTLIHLLAAALLVSGEWTGRLAAYEVEYEIQHIPGSNVGTLQL